MSESKKYNGWTNYETWNYALWLDNDQGYERAQQVYNEARAENTFSRKETAALRLADILKYEADEFAQEQMREQSNWLSDAVNAYLSEVNWYEIAENYLSEVEEEEE